MTHLSSAITNKTVGKKKRPITIAILASSVLLAFFCAWAGTDWFRSFIEPYPNGRTDWDKGFFYGVGKGYPHLNKGSKARAMKVAEASALSAILQVAAQLRVDDQHTLADLEREKVIIQIKGIINYEPIERRFVQEGDHPYYEVTYRAPIKGVKGLTKQLLPHMRSGSPPQPLPPSKSPALEDDEEEPWLVLDGRDLPLGSGVQPALFPKILTEGGETVSDARTVDEGALVERGMARYVVSDADPEEIGFVPDRGVFSDLARILSPQSAFAEEGKKRKKRGRYIVKNVKQVQGLMRTNLVISESDARDLREEDASSKILKECRVVVVVSSSLGGIEGRLPGQLALSR